MAEEYEGGWGRTGEGVFFLLLLASVVLVVALFAVAHNQPVSEGIAVGNTYNRYGTEGIVVAEGSAFGRIVSVEHNINPDWWGSDEVNWAVTVDNPTGQDKDYVLEVLSNGVPVYIYGSFRVPADTTETILFGTNWDALASVNDIDMSDCSVRLEEPYGSYPFPILGEKIAATP